MAALGFEPFLPAAMQAPVIVTFRLPPGGWFGFEAFYAFLHARGAVIYPGKLTQEPGFRIGCIGAIGAEDIGRALPAVGGCGGVWGGAVCGLMEGGLRRREKDCDR